MYFLSFRIFEQLALALKNRVALEFFTCIEIIFIIQDFWATCACPENRSFPELFRCIEYTFYIQEFWAICACPEKQKVPWIYCTEYVFFIIQDFEKLPLALKNTVALKIFTLLNMCFLSFRIFEQLALKNRVTLEFFTWIETFLNNSGF